ncbi:MAG: hypothetical protein PHX37_02825, partial [Eubacteriales bacterium]|nr:hypothetical protein [Eubacteriales bacterium]
MKKHLKILLFSLLSAVIFCLSACSSGGNTDATSSADSSSGSSTGDVVPSQTTSATEEEKSPYRIYISRSAFTMIVFSENENGEYTKADFYRVALGNVENGIYKIEGKERWHAFENGR